MSRNTPHPGQHQPAQHRLISRLIRNLGCAAGGLGLSTSLLAAAGSWDCRVGPDGGWQCSRDGIPEVRPHTAASPTITPLRTTAPTISVPATAIVETHQTGRSETVTEESPGAETSRPAAAVEAAKPSAPAPVAKTEHLAGEAPYEVRNTPPDRPHENVADTGRAVPATPEAPVEVVTAGMAQDRKAPAAPPKEERAAAQQAEDDKSPPTNNIGMLDQDIGWQSCSAAITPPTVAFAGTGQAPIDVFADGAEFSGSDNRALFSGNVILTQGSQELYAREVHFDRNTGELRANGDVLLKRPDLRIAASEVQYNLQTYKGAAQQAEYRLPGILARGTAQKAELIDSANSTYSEISYTTCPPDNNDWQLSADKLQLDTAEGLGTATDAKLSFKGVPLMYLPTLTFPIDDRRRSGLLIPSAGYGDRHGLDLSLPYYFNLAPNYDLTLVPRLMSKRGIMLGGEFRFLTSRHEGEIHASYIHHDQQAPDSENRRGSLSVRTRSKYSERLGSSLNINYVSDDNFLEDFGADLETYSSSHLERAAEVHYAGQQWSASAGVQLFQTIDPLLPKADRPYASLPRLRFDLAKQTDTQLPVDYAINAEYVDFRKSGGFVEGRRLDLKPTIALPKREAWYHLIPALGLRYTRYELEHQSTGKDASPDRLTPILSLDSGLYFDREMNWFGHAATQSLEPRAYYLFVPQKSQGDIPVFDTAERDFSFASLFRDNRFSGADRQGDANQLALAVTSRINDLNTGQELLRASLGQIVYLRDRKVQLPGIATQTQQTSPLIGEVSARLSQQWRARSELVWDPDSNNVEQALARASYRGDNNHIFSAAYRLRDTTSSQTDLAAIWPIGERTRAIARWNYSLSEQRNLDALAGVEYGKCCWKIRALLRQQARGTGNDQNLSFLLQLELRGLGKLGDNIDAILKNGIYGYRREDD